MSKSTNRLLEDADEYATETSLLDDDVSESPADESHDDDEITDEDYGFILDAEGNLKSVFLPIDYEVIPEKVYAIFGLFGIDDVAEIHRRIGHSVH